MDYNGDSLKWDYKDMKKGFKVMSNGRKILFTECLLQKSMMKMDIVSIVDGIMTEFSEKYYITIGGESNFLEFDSNPEYMQNQVLHSYYEYLDVKQDYFKALKRAFSYKKSVDKIKYKNQLLKMLEFFNSDAGILNKIKSELDTMIVMKEQTFKPVLKADYNMNIMKIMEFIEAHKTIKLKVKLTDDLTSIEKLKDKINDELQTDSLKFIKLNPDVLINKI